MACAIFALIGVLLGFIITTAARGKDGKDGKAGPIGPMGFPGPTGVAGRDGRNFDDPLP